MAVPVSALVSPPSAPGDALAMLEKAVWCAATRASGCQRCPAGCVDLFFTSPPYADARPYCAVKPDEYVEWFEPYAAAMFEALAPCGSFVLNMKNRVASSGPLRGQRHPYVFELVLRLQGVGVAVGGDLHVAQTQRDPWKFRAPHQRQFEFCFHFAKGPKPYFDLDAVRVPYRADEAEIQRRRRDKRGRRNTEAGFGRDRSKVYRHGGADPGNVIAVPQTYNQHKGPAGMHTAVMPERLAEFFIKLLSPPGRSRGRPVRRFRHDCGRGPQLRPAGRRRREECRVRADRPAQSRPGIVWTGGRRTRQPLTAAAAPLQCRGFPRASGGSGMTSEQGSEHGRALRHSPLRPAAGRHRRPAVSTSERSSAGLADTAAALGLGVRLWPVALAMLAGGCLVALIVATDPAAGADRVRWLAAGSGAVLCVGGSDTLARRAVSACGRLR